MFLAPWKEAPEQVPGFEVRKRMPEGIALLMIWPTGNGYAWKCKADAFPFGKKAPSGEKIGRDAKEQAKRAAVHAFDNAMGEQADHFMAKAGQRGRATRAEKGKARRALAREKEASDRRLARLPKSTP